MQIECKNCGEIFPQQNFMIDYENLKRELLMVRNHTVSLRRELSMVNQELEWQKQQYQIICKQARMTPAWYNLKEIEVEVMKIVMEEQEAKSHFFMDKGMTPELEDK